MSQIQWVMRSAVGSLYLVAGSTGLQGLYFRRQPIPERKTLNSQEPEVLILKKAVRELEEYFDGGLREFSVPLALKGTPFQEKVWGALTQIPYGETKSYREVAEKIQQGKAYRAVGTANGKNPLSIIVPCHRVIASDGTLGGYGGGLTVKAALLRLESRKMDVMGTAHLEAIPLILQ